MMTRLRSVLVAVLSSFFLTVSVGTAYGVLVVNEIDYDQPGTDTLEFIELFNPTASPVDLTGFQLQLVSGGTTPPSVYMSINLPSTLLAAGDFFVVCGNSSVQNCDLNVNVASNLIQNGAPDAVALFSGTSLVDTVSYEGDTPGFTEGSGVGLEDPSAVTASIARIPNGVDTNMNNVDFKVTLLVTPGFANPASIDGQVPEPSLLILFGAGLAGLGWRLKVQARSTTR